MLLLLEKNSHARKVIVVETSQIILSSIRQNKSIRPLALGLGLRSSPLAADRVIATTGISVSVRPVANPRVAIVPGDSLEPVTVSAIVASQLELQVLNVGPANSNRLIRTVVGAGATAGVWRELATA